MRLLKNIREEKKSGSITNTSTLEVIFKCLEKWHDTVNLVWRHACDWAVIQWISTAWLVYYWLVCTITWKHLLLYTHINLWILQAMHGQLLEHSIFSPFLYSCYYWIRLLVYLINFIEITSFIITTLIDIIW
jgi:hypothetical protein